MKMENSELLNSSSKNEGTVVTKNHSNGSALVNHEKQPDGPPDGGVRAWSVVVGSFLINGLLFGVINSCSVIYEKLDQDMKAQNVTGMSGQLALVGSLSIGTTFFLSPVSALLTSAMGLRLTAIVGGTIAASGMLLSSFFVEQITPLYFTNGVMYGVGAALAYTPSLAILGHYFKRNLGMVNGIVASGSPAFTMVMPLLQDHLIKKYGLPWTYRVLAFITFGVAMCSLLFKPTPLMLVNMPNKKGKNGIKALIKEVVDVNIYKKKKYLIWTLSIPVALFGYFVPYVHITKFIEQKFATENKNLALQCIAGTSLVGRIVFGFLGDVRNVDRIFLQQISFYALGILTIFLALVNKYWQLVVVALGMGIFDGAFISLLGPVAFDLVGSKSAAQAIGCLLGLASVGVTVGPLVAGYIYDISGSYTIPFALAGIPPLVGASLMFLIRFIKSDSNEVDGSNINHIRESELEPMQKNHTSKA